MHSIIPSAWTHMRLIQRTGCPIASIPTPHSPPRSVKTYPVREILDHEMHATLEWVLPSPLPLHCFDQSPIVIEVQNRNPDFDEH